MEQKFKIIHISDTHNYHKYVDIPDGDLLIHSGDISRIGSREDVESFLKWFARQKPTYKILIAGNHDRTFDPKFNEDGKKPTWLIEALENFTKNDALNFYLENSSCEIEGIKFWGSPYSSWFHGDRWAFNVRQGEDAKKMYSEIPMGTNVVITHGPPHMKCDLTMTTDEYVGCPDLLRAIQKVKPKFHLFGHIHEAYGRDCDQDTIYLNGSICTLAYEPRNKPHIFDYYKEYDF